MDFKRQRSHSGEGGTQQGQVYGHSAHIPAHEANNFHAARDSFVNSFRQQENLQHVHTHENASEMEPRRIVKILDKLITFCLSAIFFGIPLFFTGLSLQGISFEKQIYFYFWLLLALVAWASRGVIVGEMKIRRTPLDFPMLFFWVVYSLGLVFSIDKWHSFWGFFGDPSRGFMNVTALVATYYLVISHFDKKRFIIISSALIVSDFILALWSLLLLLGLNFVPERVAQFVPISPIGSTTGLGIFLGAMLPLLIALIFGLSLEKRTSPSKTKNVLFVGLFATLLLNLGVLLVLYAFVAWLGVLVGVSFFLIYILAQIVRPGGNLSWLPMLVFMAILAILMVGSNSIARIQLPAEASPSYQMSWEIARNSLKENLLIGSGPATYGYDFSLHKPQSFNLNPYYNLRFFQATGIFFEALSTLGLIGTIAVLLLALTFLSVGIYLLSVDKQKNKIYSLGIFAAALVMLVNAFAGKTEGSILIIGALIGALAIAMLMRESGAEENYLTLSLKASPKFALALAFVFMVVSAGVVFLFVFVGKIYLADLWAGRAMREQKITQDGSVQKMAGAISRNNRESRYYTLLGQQLMTLANEETLKGEKDRKLELIQDYLNNSIASVNQAKNLAPRDVSVVEALAQIYENSGLYVADSFALAEDNYRKALELEPHNPVYFVKLGQIKLAQAANKKTPEEAKAVVGEAKDLFLKAINEKNNLAVAYYQLALSQEALGEMDDAVKSIEQAAVLEQGNLNFVYNVARIHQGRGNEEDNKIAEAIYKNILSKNDKEINTRFSLGLLYEKTKRNNDATAEYKKVLALLPADSKDIRAKIEKMLSNIANGIENKPENLKLDSEVAPMETVPIDSAVPAEIPAAAPTQANQ